jgi:hypothetical protein
MMLFREVIAVYCKNDMKRIITLWQRRGVGMQILFSVKAGGTFS